MSCDSVFTARFFRMSKEIIIDGLINCIEAAKRECMHSEIDWEIVTFFYQESGKKISKSLTFRKDMFSNRVYFAMKKLSTTNSTRMNKEAQTMLKEEFEKLTGKKVTYETFAAWEAAYMTTGGESPLNERKDRMAKTCRWCYDIETRRVCPHCHGTGFEPEDQAVLLVTANTKRANTKRETAYSSIFVRLNDNGTKLNDTEKRVLEMIRQDLDVWSCGCITGIPETMFLDIEFRNLHKHGIGKRFEGNGSWWGNEQNTPESVKALI